MYTQHNGMSCSTNNNNDLSYSINQNLPFIKQEIKHEPLDIDSNIVLQNTLPHGIKRPGDPYEFDEEGGGGACNMEGFNKRGPGSVDIKEEPKDKKMGTGNLFTSEGLQPSYKDLDQIFDNSDDTSGDEAVSIGFCKYWHGNILSLQIGRKVVTDFLKKYGKLFAVAF